ncbi:MAG: hypothetical protein ACR2JV_07430 [Gaiellales bacterium]
MDAAAAREADLRDALRGELAQLDSDVLVGIGRALERDRDRLIGGVWGAGDDGCLLTLAARELGYAEGEDLLATSVAAVRVPALFDELWALILARSGDAAVARSLTHRLVVEALALRPQERSEEAPSATARIALPR